MRPRKYFGVAEKDGRLKTMIATVTGQMEDGTMVYTECDGFGNLVDMDKQYSRTLKHGWQYFERL